MFQLDELFIASLSAPHVADRYQPLAAQLRQRRLGPLLEYVCYQDNAEVQVAAIQLAAYVAVRLPNVVELLQAPNFDLSVPLNLRRGFALALKQSLLSSAAADELPADLVSTSSSGDATSTTAPSSTAAADSSAGGAGGSSDVRAAMILQLLLSAADTPYGPNLAHLLMGYDPELRPDGVTNCMLLPIQEFSCATIILRALAHRDCALSVSKPRLYAQCLQLLLRLGASPVSGPPLLSLLAPPNSDLPLLLQSIVTTPLPPLARPHTCVASLQQRSHIMRLQALLLLRVTDESATPILASLFGAGPAMAMDGGASDMDGGAARALNGGGELAGGGLTEVLQLVSGLAPSAPHLSDIPGEERRLHTEMAVGDISIDMLLTNEVVMQQTGVRMLSDAGDVLFNFDVLKQLLKERYDEYVAKSGQRGASIDLARAAVASAFRFAQQYNSYALVAGAQRSTIEGWMQLVEVVFSKRYATLARNW